jgi:hypothetical protein
MQEFDRLFGLTKIPSRSASVKIKEDIERFFKVRNLRELGTTGAMGDSGSLLRRDWAHLNVPVII